MEHCNGLSERGHEVTIVTTTQDFTFEWIKIHPAVKVVRDCTKVRDEKLLNNYDVIVSTYFSTFYEMIGWKDLYPNAKLYYFVQQLEDRFFTDATAKQRVKRTYEMSKHYNVGIITEAKWLRDELKRLYGFDPIYVPNCQILPEEIPKTEIKTNKVKVLVEGNAEAPGKGVQDAWPAIKDLDCYKILLTNSTSFEVSSEFKFDEMFCCVPWNKALSVIQAGDILVKPSYFEGSPTPIMEAWELGTAVVTTNCTGWDEYGIKDINCKLVNIGDVEGIRNAVNELINDKHEREILIANGKRIAMNEFHGWKKSIDLLENTFKK